jgi:hypothetical protein
MAQRATATLAQKEVFPVPPFPEATVIALPKVAHPFLGTIAHDCGYYTLF